MANFHNWTGDEEIDKQVPQLLNEDNAATQEKLDTKFNKSLEIAEASDLNNFKDEGFYCCNSNSRAETILNCPTNYAFGLMVWGKDTIVYQEVREYNRSTNNLEYNNCWRRSYYSGEGVQGTWSKWQQMSYSATTLAGYGITDGMRKNVANSVSTTDIMKRDVNTSYLRLTGGSAVDSGAALQLCGGAYTGEIADAGEFSLKATDSTHSVVLLGNPSGVLKWDNKNIVRSVNNSVADDNGNVTITVDAELSATSTNPIQNKAVNTAINTVKSNMTQGFQTVTARIPTKFSELQNDEGYASLSYAHTWAELQTFNKAMLLKESYQTEHITSDGTNPTTTPNRSTMHLTIAPEAGVVVPSQQILNMSTIVADCLSANNTSTVFTAYITSDADYTLTITNAGTIKYIGSASDVAITSAGLLLNIMMLKDASGNVTSTVQASKLS